ncbi:MAG: T9SS type A sorting domain-containing protein [Ignavibacteriae bacterium]|nr:T9SS type A sorting domain-containing protein [Ignavibacteriota bacterium]
MSFYFASEYLVLLDQKDHDCSRNLEFLDKIYNLLGQVVATLVDEVQDAGYKSVEWNACGSASGVYFYRINAGEFVETKKLILLR